ncbi:hypothetical protein [Aeromicrobium sp. HA]|uniref:hypothetical protein n=1 Tax=Aeromicrobium sp. HA TaxID=3009077 RepID=UPI0022AFAEA3|nr:hypothetical protein [Aeromicrobium sp. HA]
MTRLQIALRTIVAALLAGALCALGPLGAGYVSHLVHDGEEPGATLGWLLVVWLFYGVPLGVVVGSVLGAAPVVVSVTMWPALQGRLGTEKAIETTVLVVGGIVALEMLVVMWAGGFGPFVTIAWTFGIAVVCTLILRGILRGGWRHHQRWLARHGATY